MFFVFVERRGVLFGFVGCGFVDYVFFFFGVFLVCGSYCNCYCLCDEFKEGVLVYCIWGEINIFWS